MTVGRFVSKDLPELAQPDDFGVLFQGRQCVGLRFDRIEIYCTYAEFWHHDFKEWFCLVPMTRVNHVGHTPVSIHITR